MPAVLWSWDARRDVSRARRSKGSDPQKRRGLQEPAFTVSSHTTLLTSCPPGLLQRASLPGSLGPIPQPCWQPCNLHIPPRLPAFTVYSLFPNALPPLCCRMTSGHPLRPHVTLTETAPPPGLSCVPRGHLHLHPPEQL